MIYKLLLLLLFCLLSIKSWALGNKVNCGVATGFPPYQFNDQYGAANGFDIDILKLVSYHAKIDLKIHQDIFDEVLSVTIHTDTLDCIAGIEYSELRSQYLDFTRPYYERRVVIFALFRNDAVNKLEDLIGKLITGDEQSTVDLILKDKGMKDRIRIKRTESKAESMDLLARKEFEAVIMPKAVGYYLANQKGIKLKIVHESNNPSPVAFAVKKDNRALLEKLDSAIEVLLESGTIQKSYDKWFHFK